MRRGFRFKLTVWLLKRLGWKAGTGRDGKGIRYLSLQLKDGTTTTWLHAHIYVHNLPAEVMDPWIEKGRYSFQKPETRAEKWWRFLKGVGRR